MVFAPSRMTFEETQLVTGMLSDPNNNEVAKMTKEEEKSCDLLHRLDKLLQMVLQNAVKQSRIISGIENCTDFVETHASQSYFCIIPVQSDDQNQKSSAENLSNHIYVKLIESLCFERAIPVLRVDFSGQCSDPKGNITDATLGLNSLREKPCFIVKKPFGMYNGAETKLLWLLQNYSAYAKKQLSFSVQPA